MKGITLQCVEMKTAAAINAFPVDFAVHCNVQGRINWRELAMDFGHTGSLRRGKMKMQREKKQIHLKKKAA